MLVPQNCCLVAVDVQEKLMTVMNDPDRLVRNCSILIQAARLLGIPILWCQQVPAALGETIGPLREHLEGLSPINKTSFSCCGEPAFVEAMDETGAMTAIVCGIETHVCVYQTAADLMARGLKVYVAADAVTSRTVENKQTALSRMAHEEIKVTSTEMLLFEILRDAKHPQFKAIAKLIR